MRRTKLIRLVKESFDEKLETLLPRVVGELGLTGASDHLGVAKATLGYWMLKLGITVARVCQSPGETIHVTKTTAAGD